MSDENDDFEQWMRGLYAAAHASMEEGYTISQVRSSFIEKGVDEEIAILVASDVSAIRQAARRKAGEKNMTIGGIWLAIGIAVSVATYVAAEGGGTYIVAWGAMVFGAIKFIRGLAQSSGSNAEPANTPASSPP